MMADRDSLPHCFSLVLKSVASFAVGASLLMAQSKAPEVYLDVQRPAAERAADLVRRLSLEEKAAQMGDVAPAIPRLRVPAYNWWNEALHGVARAGLATVFPQAIGMAASWDLPLMHQTAEVISTEGRAKYNFAVRNGDRSRYHGLTFWSPNINIFRDPRWGRGQETYGEDPFLTGKLAVQFIRGLQGDHPKYLKTVATAKHYAVHSGPEPLRHGFNVNPSDTDLNQTYLPAFEMSVKDGKAASVMCSYNAVNGLPACANPDLLERQLRKDWGFQGYVVSDCGAVSDILTGHKFKPDMPQASAAAVSAGTDLSCGDEYNKLVSAVKNKQIDEAKLDQALIRLFTARMQLGLFDPPDAVPFSRIGDDEIASQQHHEVALKMARESMVLLKNEKNVLPLQSKVKSILVTGPAADDPDTLLANYNGIPRQIVTPRLGIEQEFAGKAKVRFAQGSTFTEISNAVIPTDVLTPGGASSPSTAHGLQAEYFSNTNWAGEPVVRRIEPRGYFNWDSHDPALAGKIDQARFSMRWKATLRVPVKGTYKIGFTRLMCADCKGNDSARLTLDGRVIAEDSKKVGWIHRPAMSEVTLEANRSYVMEASYMQDGGAAGLQLVWLPPAQALLEEATSAAAQADVIVACVGLNAALEGEEMPVKIAGFAGGDRTDLVLPAQQRTLLNALYQTGKPVIVVLANGSAVAVPEAKKSAAAILESWYGGEAGGSAVAETLSGKNNPAGRLPVTFYQSVDQLPAFENYSMQGRTYRYFQGEPLYPFGYGLSYSSFSYKDLQVKGAADGYEVSATVTNTSDVPGEEVAQLYVTGANGSASPRFTLRGFERFPLAARESRIVRFSLTKESLAGLAMEQGSVSIGGGLPIKAWSSFVEGKLPAR